MISKIMHEGGGAGRPSSGASATSTLLTEEEAILWPLVCSVTHDLWHAMICHVAFFRPCLFHLKTKKFSRFSVTSNLWHMHA